MSEEFDIGFDGPLPKLRQDEPLDLGDRSDVNERNKDIDRRRRARDHFLLEMMSRPVGRDWMWDVLSRCGLYRIPDKLDQATMAFANGERNVGLGLLVEISRVAPEQYLQMMKEALANG